MTNNGRLKQPGILIVDFNKCLVLFANQEGLLVHRQGKNGDPSWVDRELGFQIKRFCLRLKKLFSSATDGALAGSRTETMEVRAGDTHYRLVGSVLTNESVTDHCLFIVVEEVKEEGTWSAPKLNLGYYQSTYKLTRREIQVLELLSKGASYKEIAYTLSISEHTVRDHIKNIRLKLHADSKCGVMAQLIKDTGLPKKDGIHDHPVEETPAGIVDARLTEPASTHDACGVAIPITARITQNPTTRSARVKTSASPSTARTGNGRTGGILQARSGRT